MIKQGEILWRLQELKQEEVGLTQTEEIKAIIKKLKALKDNVKTGEKELLALTELIKKTEDEVKELEKESTNRTELAKLQKEKLYEAKGSSLKELLALQQAVLKLETQGKAAENKYWEFLKKIEEYKQKNLEYKQAIKACRKAFNQDAIIYKKLKAKTELKLAEIKSHQEEVQEQLLPEVLKIYKDAEKRYPISFIAVLRQESCMGCHIGVSSNLVKRVKEGKQLQYCDNCGRILINKK